MGGGGTGAGAGAGMMAWVMVVAKVRRGGMSPSHWKYRELSGNRFGKLPKDYKLQKLTAIPID